MRMKRPITILIFALSIIGLLIPLGNAAALSGSEFNASRIIDDGLFFNANSMTASEIQQFLNSKVPACDTNGTQPYGGTTRAAYGASKGYPAPYTCIKDYSVSVPGRAPDSYCGGSVSAGVKTAAQLIYDVSQACGVSPMTLIILLQKEQSLITDDWPWPIQYEKATGYACPDTAPCSPEFAGLFNQLYYAARQYQRYALQSHLFNFKNGVTSYVQYNPNGGCGGTNITMQNQATAGLYNYTPYQPNAAALNNLYGTGDGCSAYGNRNFWRMWNDWFGSTNSPQFGAQPVWQQVYTDATKAQSAGWGATFLPGQSAYAVVVMKNIGTKTWTKSGAPGVTDTRLATYGPWGRQSAFCNNNWLFNCSRPATMNEASVAPGQTGTFEFPIKAPPQPGLYNESFGLVVDGRTTFSTGFMNFQLQVAPKTYSAQPVWQQVYTDATKASSMGWGANLLQKQNAYAVVAMKNTGNFTWEKGGINEVRIATYGWGRSSAFCTSQWLIGCVRPARMNESSVSPGQTATFEFPITAPDQTGLHNEVFGLVVDGASTFSSGFMNFPLQVNPRNFTGEAVWQQIYTDSNKSTPLGWGATMSPNQSGFAVVAIKNTSNFSWTKSGSFGLTDTRLATYGPWGRQSAFCNNNWLLNCNRPAALKETSVAPGQVGTFEFPIKAPGQSGSYNESFAPVVDGRATFSAGAMNFNIVVE